MIAAYTTGRFLVIAFAVLAIVGIGALFLIAGRDD